MSKKILVVASNNNGKIKEIKEILKKNGVETIKDLCSKTKTYLKNMRLSFYEINKIQVEVQLLGLNLQKCE